MGTRKQLILVAAVRLLETRGWNKTTVAAIAREANVGTGTVYLEFCSKESIMHELSSRRFGEVLRAMRRAAMRPGSWSERFRGVMNARTKSFIELGACSAHTGQLLHCTHPSVQSAREAFSLAQLELLTDLIAAAAEDELVREGDPSIMAQNIILAYHAFSPPRIFDVTLEAAITQMESLHDIILGGLLKRAP